MWGERDERPDMHPRELREIKTPSLLLFAHLRENNSDVTPARLVYSLSREGGQRRARSIRIMLRPWRIRDDTLVEIRLDARCESLSISRNTSRFSFEGFITRSCRLGSCLSRSKEERCFNPLSGCIEYGYEKMDFFFWFNVGYTRHVEKQICFCYLYCKIYVKNKNYIYL